ncbi:hypothetical protein [Mycobacterium paraseoulense]|uniref:Uncharacterized protein n=1 Tax=Mycobacterium paraseoulense TaxID=590652 RepID=A0A1X0I758_9MYCO|nr:hypothetical protein [Mycobacterium paraseoulense]MCV7395945.1 hypothetical protein [Mycobacterium paraseoulense]ORB37446.1 hypothetical protein BST39_18955 [Mycobacterium paraseoulense]BBZ72344.1 hypothetical protein MPRS_34370 [Mycobacterium paraseoulense]
MVAPVSLRAANYPVEYGRDFPLTVLAAVGVWALSLAIGLFELLVGHEGVAIAALVVSVVAPWLGLALAHYPAIARRLRRRDFRWRNFFGPGGVTRA